MQNEEAVRKLAVFDELRQELDETRRLLSTESFLNKTIIDNIPGPFYVFDKNWRYIRWSAYDRDVINGKTDNEMPGTSATESIHPEDIPLLSEKMENAFMTGCEETIEARVLLKGGPEYRWYLLTGRWVKIEGETIGIGFGIDIHERKKAEDENRRLTRALHATNKCNQALIEADDELDLLHKVCRVMVETGGYLAAWIGYVDEDETEGVRPVTHAGFGHDCFANIQVSWEEVPAGCSAAGRAIRTGKPVFVGNIREDPSIESLRIAADGFGDYSVQSFPLSADNKVMGALTIYSSPQEAANAHETALLTSLSENCAYGIRAFRTRQAKVQLDAEYEKLQANLQQTQKMEMVGQLAGGIAHDFNNILTTIQGNVELVLTGLDPTMRHYKNLTSVVNSVQRSAAMVRQLLSFARKNPSQPVDIEVDAEIHQTNLMLRKLIREDIRLDLKLNAAHALVHLDPSTLVQILSNLIVNARDAIAESGTILIETGIINKDEPACVLCSIGGIDKPHIRIKVSDTGSGIDPQTLPHIFEPFFTTKGIGKGTGLGLSTVYGLVKQNHGHLFCTSEVGSGTTVEIHFPGMMAADNNDAGSSAPVKMPRATGLRERILVVEDEHEISSIIKKILESQGMWVVVAENGESALRFIESCAEPFDLVISDIVLPGMNGMQLRRSVLGKHPEAKFLFMSGYSADAIGLYGVFDDERNFIPKPFTVIDFINRVRAVLINKS